MPKILPADFFIPKKPNQQVIESYDAISISEKTNILNQYPESFINVLSAGDSASTSIERNDAIRKKWVSFLNSNAYKALEAPGILFYEIQSDESVFSGFLCSIAVDSFIKYEVTKHEHILPSRVSLMKDYLKTVQIQAEPILVVHEDVAEIMQLEQDIPKSTPELVSFSYKNQTHRLWLLNTAQEKQLMRCASEAHHFHLADGHHRSACVEALFNSKTTKKPKGVFSFLSSKRRLINKSFYWYLEQLPETCSVEWIEKKVKALQGIRIEHTVPTTEDFPLQIAFQDKIFALPSRSVTTSTLPDFITQSLLVDELAIDKIKLNYFPQRNSNTMERLINHTSFALALNMLPMEKERLFALAIKKRKLPPKSTLIFPKLLTGFVIAGW